MTDLSASLRDLGDTILQAFFVQPQLFALTCQQVLVQADELKVALHASTCTYSMLESWTDEDALRTKSSSNRLLRHYKSHVCCCLGETHAGWKGNQASLCTIKPASSPWAWCSCSDARSQGTCVRLQPQTGERRPCGKQCSPECLAQWQGCPPGNEWLR